MRAVRASYHYSSNTRVGPICTRPQAGAVRVVRVRILDGDVRVRNESYADPTAHEYRVRIRNDEPDSCSCPADASGDGPCKHRVVVAIRPRILELAVQMGLT
ncbi:SWIM zinc finger family protein [Haloferax sulfurifontis]|uniref:SWIM zinc finger family protein n=1 Tax=Haloferax sulfurifontis TaxID=255616 RepID=UPI0027B9090C|nr:SWIM zinc finger family protein [Haloferax sulfurifontis]